MRTGYQCLVGQPTILFGRPTKLDFKVFIGHDGIKMKQCPTPSTAAKGPLSYAIFRLARLHRTVAATLLRKVGLHPGQEIVMMELWDKDDLMQNDLVKAVGIDASTVTKMVQRLEAEGFVTRKSCPDDKRSMRVRLTAKGKKLKSEIEDLWKELERRTTADLSASEQKEAYQMIQKIEQSLFKECPKNLGTKS